MSTKSMTEGNALKQILAFAFPLLLGNLFQQFYNIADAAIVGQTLGAQALGAVGVSSSVQFLVLGFCIGTATGFAIPVATAFGAKRQDDVKQYVFLGEVLTLLLAVVLCVLTVLSCRNILSLLKAPQEIMSNAHAYLVWIFAGIPFTFLYNYCASILRAIGDSKTPFYFLTFSSILNIALDLYCIICLHWGVAGAAIATVFSQALSGILCLLLIKKKVPVLNPSKEHRRWNKEKVHHLLKMGVPMGLQFSITAIGSMVMQTANNSLGTIYVSGFAAGLKLKQFAMCPFDALGAAVSTFLSQNNGAGRMDRIKEGVKIGEITGILYGIGIGLILIFFGRFFSQLFVSAEDIAVLDASGAYLRALGFFYWMLGILIVTRMCIQGLGFSRLAIFAGVLEMIARSVVALLFVEKFGYTAIIYSDQVAWFAAILYLIPTLKHCLHIVENDIHARQLYSKA